MFASRLAIKRTKESRELLKNGALTQKGFGTLGFAQLSPDGCARINRGCHRAGSERVAYQGDRFDSDVAPILFAQL
jgi:hypothetical protein